jgi:hypothetical protein
VSGASHGHGRVSIVSATRWRGAASVPVETPEVVERALGGHDTNAKEALERFAVCLDRSPAMPPCSSGPRGRLHWRRHRPQDGGRLSASAFHHAFEAKGRMSTSTTDAGRRPAAARSRSVGRTPPGRGSEAPRKPAGPAQGPRCAASGLPPRCLQGSVLRAV